MLFSSLIFYVMLGMTRELHSQWIGFVDFFIESWLKNQKEAS